MNIYRTNDPNFCFGEIAELRMPYFGINLCAENNSRYGGQIYFGRT